MTVHYLCCGFWIVTTWTARDVWLVATYGLCAFVGAVWIVVAWRLARREFPR